MGGVMDGKVAVVTNQGFRDLLEIGRQKRPDLYDIFADKPQTLVPRALRFEVPERLLHDGSVETALDEDAVRRAGAGLRAAGVEAVAICFLYAFVNPAHEQRARAILEQELPGVFLCASHEIAPEFREFERLSTATVNAYLGPIMQRYIRRLTPRPVRGRQAGSASVDAPTRAHAWRVGPWVRENGAGAGT